MGLSNTVGDNEVFSINLNTDDGSWNIKSKWNNFVNSNGDTTSSWINQQTWVGGWEKWYFDPAPSNDGRWCIRNHDSGYYLSINTDGTVAAEGWCFEDR